MSEAQVEEPPNQVAFLVCVIGGHRYAIEAGHVADIRESPPVTRVPRAPPIVEGVAAVDGDVVAVLSLYSELGGAGDTLLCFDRPGQPVALLIDEADVVAQYPVDSISTLAASEASPPGGENRWFKAVLETDAGPVFVLDRDRIVEAARSR